MRYSKEHKAETHDRSVVKAAIRLREKGVHGVGVADLMKEAGLTHGGFYAHFNSREALVIEAFTRTMDASIRNWRKASETTPAAKQLATMVGNYLSPQHRDAPGHGCAIPTLGGDIVRESPKTRRAFATKIDEMVGVIAELMPELPPAAARREALATMSAMVGTLLLSRIAGTGDISDEILEAGRDSLLAKRAVSRSKSDTETPAKRARPAKARLPR